jgi:hypothetical protein
MILVLTVATLLVIGGLCFIALPLARPPASETPSLGTVSPELLARRDRIYGELRELEFDFHVGKVTDPEYSLSRDRLESEAARVLRAIDVEIASLEQAIEREVNHLREASSECSACGATVNPGARFCPACGAPVPIPVRP